MSLDLQAGETNKLEKQTEAVNSLIQLAIKYNLAIVLVAHPRKTQVGAQLDLTDMSGSSNIGNLSHRTIALKRVTKREREDGVKHDVTVTVLKDRIFGRIGEDIPMYYDPYSRRFFSNEDEFNRQYAWDSAQHNIKSEYPVKDESIEVFGDK